MYKSPACGCCQKWVEYMESHGFQVTTHDEDALDRIKDKLGVPGAVRSCHTAHAGGRIIEGHVPAEDVRRFLSGRPTALGLAVPGMVTGTPGMEVRGGPPARYEVVAFSGDGTTRVYARH